MVRWTAFLLFLIVDPEIWTLIHGTQGFGENNGRISEVEVSPYKGRKYGDGHCYDNRILSILLDESRKELRHSSSI